MFCFVCHPSLYYITIEQDFVDKKIHFTRHVLQLFVSDQDDRPLATSDAKINLTINMYYPKAEPSREAVETTTPLVDELLPGKLYGIK